MRPLALLAALALLVGHAGVLRAGERIEVTYRAGEAESEMSARTGAMSKLRMAAMPHLGQWLRGHTELRNEQLQERIEVLAEAAIRLRDVQENWETEGASRILRVSATVEIDGAAVERFLRSVEGTEGVSRLPLDDPLIQARKKRLDEIERNGALMHPWTNMILKPILATPVQLELLDLKLPSPYAPKYDQQAVATVRVTWEMPYAAVTELCLRMVCSTRPVVKPVQAMMTNAIWPAETDLVRMSPEEIEKVTLWAKELLVIIAIRAPADRRSFREVPVLYDDSKYAPAMGRIRKTLVWKGSTVTTVKIDPAALEGAPELIAYFDFAAPDSLR